MKKLPTGRILLGKDGNRIDDIFIHTGKKDVCSALQRIRTILKRREHNECHV